MNQKLLDSHHINLHYHKLVAKIALSVCAASFSILLITLTLITNDAGESYGATIYSHALTRQQLKPAMLVAALVLISITCLITWFITLYSSFRLAWPLYRFTQHFKLATINPSAMEMIPIRKGDTLQEQAATVKQAFENLHDHYLALKEITHEASSALTAGDSARYSKAVARLKHLDEKVHI